MYKGSNDILKIPDGFTADDLILQWKPADESPISGSPEIVGYDAAYSFSNQTVVFGMYPVLLTK